MTAIPSETGSYFLINPSIHRAFLDGQAARLTDEKNVVRLIALLILVSLPFIGIYGGQLAQWAALQRGGAQVNATVYDPYTGRAGGGTTYHVRYEYVVDGEIYRRDESISGGFYRQLLREGALPVRYLTSNPAISGLIGETTDAARAIVPLALCGSAVFVGIGALGTGLIRGRQLGRGELLRGELLSARLERHRLYIRYRFTSPSGKVIEKVKMAPRSDLGGIPLPPPGTPIRILYRNDHIYEAL